MRDNQHMGGDSQMYREGTNHSIALVVAEASIAALEEAVICGEGTRVLHTLGGVFEVTFRRLEGEQCPCLAKSTQAEVSIKPARTTI